MYNRKSPLRLNFPQWEGGNVHEYHFGSRVLSWLAPPANGPVETVRVQEPRNNEVLEVEEGILGRKAVLSYAREARRLIQKHRPERIVTLGGDCLIDLAPMAWLNEVYDGNLGVLWIDAHPDVITPEHFAQGNAQVLGALLGNGDEELVNEVKLPLKPANVMIAGLDEWTPVENEVITRFGLRRAGSADLSQNSDPVLDWISEQGIQHLAVHFDVDVMDPGSFGPILFNNPSPDFALDDVPKGRMTPDQVVRLLQDVAVNCEIVGLAVTEYMPWEAIATRNLLRKLPLLAD